MTASPLPPTEGTWRTLLGHLAQTPADRQRVASELGVKRYSVSRWISGEVVPRPHSLRRLPDLFPNQRAQMRRLIEEDFPGIFLPPSGLSQWEEEERTGIPSAFYERLLSALTEIEGELSSWTIAQLGMQQLLRLVDKDHLGASITLLRCTPPSPDGLIRSLHELARLDSPAPTLPLSTALFGHSSLAGRAVMTSQTQVSSQQIAVPLRRRGRLAGCLLVRSHELITVGLGRVIESYAKLFSLLFLDSDYFETHRVALEAFGSPEQQQERLGDQLGTRATDPIFFRGTTALFQQREAFLLLEEEQEATKRGQERERLW